MKQKMSKLIPSLRPPKEGRVGVRHERRGNPNSRHRERSVAILQKIASPLRGIAMTPLSVMLNSKICHPELVSGSYTLGRFRNEQALLANKFGMTVKRLGRKTLAAFFTFILVILPVTLLILFNSAKGVEAAWANEDWGIL